MYNILISYLNWLPQRWEVVNFHNLNLKMTFHNRKKLFRKDSCDGLPLLQKNHAPEDPEKASLLFHADNSQYRSELQMPIKIQNNSSFNNTFKRQKGANDYAHQSSQQAILHELCSNSESRPEFPQTSKQNHKDQYQIMIPSQNKFDSLQSLLMPLYEPNLQAGNEMPQYGFEDEYQVKIEAGNEYDNIFVQQTQGLYCQDSKILQQRRAIFSLMNSFRSFYQATTICINSHRLSRKDSLNKVYTNILSVLSKQSKKMFLELQKQKNRIDVFYQKQKCFDQRVKQEPKPEDKDQLIKTGIQGEGIRVQKQAKTITSRKDKIMFE